MRAHSAFLGALYAAHARDAVRLAQRITGDGMLAEDLVQEAFVRLADRFPDLRDPSAFRGYLRTAVMNLARSHFRRLRVERRYLERETRGQTMRWDPESHTEVWDALLRLPTRQRAAIALRYYEDLPVAQVAGVLGCPEGTVKSLVSRGIGRLRRELVPRPESFGEATRHEVAAGPVREPSFRQPLSPVDPRPRRVDQDRLAHRRRPRSEVG